MKRIFIFILFLTQFSLLFGLSYYKSNAIGQKISETDSRSLYRDGYVLEVADNYENLYLDRKLIKRTDYKTLSTDDNFIETVVSTVDYRNGEKTHQTYNNQFLVKSEIEKNGVKTVENLIYTDSSLVYISKSVGGDVQTITYFLRSAYDGSLLGVKTYTDTYSLIGEGFLYEEENLFREAGEDFILQGDFTITENGEVVYTRGNVTYTATPSGRLLKTEDAETVTEYFYDANEVLLYTIQTTGKVVKTSFYSKSNQNTPESESTLIDGIISEEIIYNKAGMIKIVYSSGVKIGTVYYEPDNLRVKNVVYERGITHK